MSFNRRWVIIPALASLAVAMLLIPRLVASGQQEGAYKLEGAWIARVTSIDGAVPGALFQWSYVLAPSASGRRASVHGSVDVGFPRTIPFDVVTPIIGEMVMTGPDTLAYNTIWYGVREGSPVDEIVLIGTASGDARVIGAGKVEVTHHFAFYLPGADVDGDGLPDGAPVQTFVVTTTDTRVPLGF